MYLYHENINRLLGLISVPLVVSTQTPQVFGHFLSVDALPHFPFFLILRHLDLETVSLHSVSKRIKRESKVRKYHP